MDQKENILQVNSLNLKWSLFNFSNDHQPGDGRSIQKEEGLGQGSCSHRNMLSDLSDLCKPLFSSSLPSFLSFFHGK